MKFLLLSLFVSVVLLSSCKQEEPADVIYYNAELWTGDSAMPHVHAIAVKGNMIIYAGDDYKSYKGSNTRMEDVKGKMIVQGFIDNHTHYS
ncbi:MAG: hypothetical protein SFU87_08220, partial [Chitinophagaceae bacterium]|nr:hypothetical protein [Chitinophagaceae bacterium]